MTDTPQISLGDTAPLPEGKRYPANSVGLKAFDTKYGLRWFPVDADGKPTVPKIAFKDPLSGKILQARPRMMSEEALKESRVATLKNGAKIIETANGRKFESCLDVMQRDHPDAWEKVERLLARNESSARIADQVHAWGVMTSTLHGTLKAAIDRHRKRQFKMRLRSVHTTSEDSNPENVATRINVLETLERMVIIQQARFEKMHRREMDSPLLMDSVSKEGDRLIDYTMKLGSMYFDTGIMARAPKVMRGVVASQAAAGVDPVRGSRIVTFEVREEELPLIEGVKNDLGQYFVSA